MNNNFFAVGAAVLSITGLFPYVRSILKGKTKPSGASWWTWGVIGFVTVLSSWSAGASWQVLLLPTWLLFVYLIIALLSIKRGDNTWDSVNKACVIGALTGLVAWVVTGQPLVALGIAIITDVFASIPNFRHVWVNPGQENLTGWTFGWLSAIFEILAITKWSLAESGWAIYFLLSMTLTMFLILRPRLIKLQRYKF